MSQRAGAAVRRPQEIPAAETAAPTAKTAEPQKDSFRSFRELIETLAIALFLSVLFKFFEAEAYVIPTGSMAPTLMGRHKDVVCPECGFAYQVNASEEMDNELNVPSGARVGYGTCPECGFTYEFGDGDRSYKGDRVIVNKCVAEMRPTRRWDVSVFRCPADPRNNYIKRIVGLPNEEVRIQYGDLFVRKTGADGTPGEFEIVRKPLDNLRQMLQTVDDNDYRPKRLLERGWPERWRDALSLGDGDSAGWLETDGGKGFYFSGKPVPKPTSEAMTYEPETAATQTDDDLAWLRYRHIVPSSSDWAVALGGTAPAAWLRGGVIKNNPQLITDQTAYNTGMMANRSNFSPERTGLFSAKSINGFGFNWSGDLALSCELSFGTFADGQEVVFELVKGGVAFRARLIPAQGTATLEIPAVPQYRSETAEVALKPNRRVSVTFMNIDEQMRLIVDGREIVFPDAGRYDYLCQPLSDGMPGVLPRNRDPNALDTTPAAIGVKAGPVEVSRLKIERDIYYIAMGDDALEPATALFSRTADGQRLTSMRGNKRCDRFFSASAPALDEDALTEFYSDPSRWGGYGNTKSALFAQGPDQFLALGDNSGLSQDSRLWGDHRDDVPHAVDRDLMLGKAICVFWPHGKPIPGTSLLLVPNFAKMRGID